MEKNGYPLPKIQECLDWLGTSVYLTKIDLILGYWQVWVKNEHILKTTLNTRYVKFEFTALLFGLINVPTIFQFIINNILWLYLDKFAIVYFNDIVIYFKMKEEYLEHVEKVLKALTDYWLYAKPSKCIIGVKSLEFYGHIMGNSIVKLMTSKVKIIDK